MGYGVRPAPRPAEPAGESGRGDSDSSREDDGEGRGRRRRRRRRSGEGRSGGSRESSGSREGGSVSGSGRAASQGRRSRRGTDSRSSSTLSRGRRDDFAPVAGGYNEDDEGLDFLGVEDAGREERRRETRPEDEEILAESGLNTVLDVPSWVEAIGIVIAGNLDARSRSPRGDDARRGDGGRR